MLAKNKTFVFIISTVFYRGEKMKISSVNSFNAYNLNKKNNSKFSGLWGQTQLSMPDIDDGLSVLRAKQCAYYYPFMDETKEEVNSVLDANTATKVITMGDGSKRILDRTCMLCKKIPVSKDDYKKYREINVPEKSKFPHLDDVQMRRAHVHSKNKFLNSGFESKDIKPDFVEQIGAENKVAQTYYQNNPQVYS